LYGGLVIILRLLTPFTIKIFWESKNQNCLIFHRINLIRSIKQLNLFKLANQRTEIDLKQQRLTTRLYLTLLIGKFNLRKEKKRIFY